MKKLLFVATLAIFALASCEKSKEELIVGKWKAINTANSYYDSLVMMEQHFIDTLGASGTPEQNMEWYGTANTDSLKVFLQGALDEMKAMQEHNIQNTWFHFRNDKTAILNFSGQQDSSKWYFDEKGMLVLDETQMKGQGTAIKLEVLHLDKDSLKLKLDEGGYSSVTTFTQVKE